MKIQFVTTGEKYFEFDPERRKEAKDCLVLVSIDTDEKTAEFICYPEDENPANYTFETDDYEAVLELAKELGKINGKEV